MANIFNVDPPVLGDTDYVDKILDSFNAIDAHDHTANKGLQVPTGGIADLAITNAKVSATADIVIAKLYGTTNSRVIVTNASTARLEVSGVTTTELNLLSGMTSLTAPDLTVITLTEQGSTPANPAAGKLKVYAKTDDKVYKLTSGGVETEIGSGGGGSSGIELLQTQNELAQIGFPTTEVDNSLRANGLEVPAHTYYTGNLIDNYVSGAASATLVWNPVVVFDSDKNYDSIASWAVGSAATTLAATAGSTKVGANHFSFNKDGSAVDAYIQHTLAAQTLNVGANYRLWFWVDMPSVTNLSNIFVRIMGAATTDFSKWDLTTNYAGSALTTGYNLMFVDLKNTAASSTGGTAWTISQLARYARFGCTSSSAGQTYTGIKFAGAWFSHGDIGAWSPRGLEFTGYDTSNKNDFVLAAASTFADGVVTLASTVAQNYTAGISNADACKFRRSTMTWSQAGLISRDTALTSGTVSTEQEIRLVRQLRESLSASSWTAYADVFTPQIYKITSVSGSSIGVDDSENHSANLLNTDQVHIFTTKYLAGVPHFTLLATRSLTANSTASSGTTTLTLTTTSIAVGDYVVKQHLTASRSIVASGANESFSALSYDTAPNGAQLIASRPYPNPNSVYSHWWLGGPSESLALKDQTGNGRNLTKVGTPNTSDVFKAGKYSSSSFTTSNYLRTAGGTVQNYAGFSALFQGSIWFYFDATLGADRSIFSPYSNSGTETSFHVAILSSQSTVNMNFLNGVSSGSITTANNVIVGWNHLLVQAHTNVVKNLWLNGVKTTGTPSALSQTLSTAAFNIGVLSNSLDSGVIQPATGLKLADCIVWRDGNLLDQSQINYLFNAGIPQFYGYNPAALRNEYSLLGVTGQQVSLKMKTNVSTTAITPSILRAGMVKV